MTRAGDSTPCTPWGFDPCGPSQQREKGLVFKHRITDKRTMKQAPVSLTRRQFFRRGLATVGAIPILAAAPGLRSTLHAAATDGIRLLVRGDDIGMTHAANLACIQSYREGIVRSVELMVPCPWFPEAVRLLEENPGLDVGIHLTLTSEWENLKWRPLTHAPSLVDADGFFFPMVWPNPNLPPKTSLRESSWDLDEVEAELRAQIETALRHLPRLSHLSAHMGFSSLDPSLGTLVRRLAREYDLETDSGAEGLKRFPGWGKARTAGERIAHFIKNLETLEPGTHLFVEHPAFDVPEMRAIGHKGYEDVAADRAAVTAVFTSPEVKAAIEVKGIRLISYQDLRTNR